MNHQRHTSGPSPQPGFSSSSDSPSPSPSPVHEYDSDSSGPSPQSGFSSSNQSQPPSTSQSSEQSIVESSSAASGDLSIVAFHDPEFGPYVESPQLSPVNPSISTVESDKLFPDAPAESSEQKPSNTHNNKSHADNGFRMYARRRTADPMSAAAPEEMQPYSRVNSKVLFPVTTETAETMDENGIIHTALPPIPADSSQQKRLHPHPQSAASAIEPIPNEVAATDPEPTPIINQNNKAAELAKKLNAQTLAYVSDMTLLYRVAPGEVVKIILSSLKLREELTPKEMLNSNFQMGLLSNEIAIYDIIKKTPELNESPYFLRSAQKVSLQANYETTNNRSISKHVDVEYISGPEMVCDLFDFFNFAYIAKPRPFNPYAFVKYLLVQAIHGLSLLHEHDIVHSDFKLENMLLGKDGLIRIIDFGCSYTQTHKANYRDTHATFHLRRPLTGKNAEDNPEYFKQDRQTFDIWALGVNFVRWLYDVREIEHWGRFSTSEIHQHIKTVDIFSSFSRFVPTEEKDNLRNIFLDMLCPNASRKTAQELKQAPLFKDVNWAQVAEGKFEKPEGFMAALARAGEIKRQQGTNSCPVQAADRKQAEAEFRGLNFSA